MKPDISEILIPSNKQEKTSPCIITHYPSLTNRNNQHVNNNCCNLSKWFIGFVMFFIIFGTVITTSVIIRYERKLNDYETRIILLEDELNIFFEHFETKGSEDISFDDLNDTDSLENDMIQKYLNKVEESEKIADLLEDNDDDSNEYETKMINSDETRFEPIVFGKMKIDKDENILLRNKRQINQRQTNVRRSEDGVPILEGTYSENTQTSSGNRNNVGFSYVGPTDSEGLRLYESLIATRGRGEPKSDLFQESDGSNVQPYHRQSAAWSSKDERISRLQLKSGDLRSRTSDEEEDDDNLFYIRSGNKKGAIDSHSSNLHNNMRTHETSNTGGDGAGSSVVSHRTSYVSSSSGVNGGSEQSNIFTRSSRVPSTNDQIYERNSRTREYQYPPLQKLGRGEGEVIARVHQERHIERERQQEQTQRPRQISTGGTTPEHVIAGATHGESTSSFAESRRYKGGYVARQNQGGAEGESDITSSRSQTNQRNRQRNNKGNNSEGQSDEFTFVKAEAWAETPKTYAAHYIADVSNFTLSHRHYEGNGRLRNVNGIFSSWKPANWMAANEATKEAFSLSVTGVLTVKKEGLYYIYAQIHYLDEHDINGFLVQINTEPFLQCTTMTETHTSNSKSNTCFTGGISYLKENDRILLKDIETNRYSIFKPEKSFFGLMKIGNTVGR